MAIIGDTRLEGDIGVTGSDLLEGIKCGYLNQRDAFEFDSTESCLRVKEPCFKNHIDDRILEGDPRGVNKSHEGSPGGNSKGVTRKDHEDSPIGGDSKGVKKNHENHSRIIENDHIRVVRNDSEESIEDDSFGHYEVYVVSPQLTGELEVALLDTGSQISLVKESS
jgi:hypothetical protein